MNRQSQPTDIAQVERWIDDLAAHEQATEQLVAIVIAINTAAREPLPVTRFAGIAFVVQSERLPADECTGGSPGV